LWLRDLANLHLAAEFGLAAVVHDIIVHEHPNVNEEGGRYGETALRLALRSGHLEVVEFLLDPAHGAKIDEYDIGAAVSHDSNAEAMMTLLLDMRGRNIKITEAILEEAAANKQCGAAVLALLLKRRGNEIKITESVVKWAARRGSTETMSLLLDKRGHEFKITEDVVLGAVFCNGREMLALLLKRRRHEIKITPIVLSGAIGSRRPENVDLLLDHSHDIKITEEMVIAAARSPVGSQTSNCFLKGVSMILQSQRTSSRLQQLMKMGRK
jgi:hypothetical protein